MTYHPPVQENRHSRSLSLSITLAMLSCMIGIVGCGKSENPVRPQNEGVVIASGGKPISEIGSTGVEVTLRSGDIEITRTLPHGAFTLNENESLDPRLPSGPFEATITLTFDRGAYREAYLGADIRGGGLIIYRDGEMLRSSYAEDEVKRVMTHQPITLSRKREQLVYEFQAEGPWPIQFRALWRPFETPVAHDLPVTGKPALDGDVLQGMKLAIDLQCASCHRAPNDALQALLEPASAPDLSDVGRRIKPSWLRTWLKDPKSLDPEARMPQVLHGVKNSEEAIEDLVHFLVAQGGPMELDNASYD
ncbi:MAG: hypothetical protein O7G85_15955, partial [Planctomycetota bacterium]|nr:hypothetical protein [Planctomycetota bacterium]